MKFPRFQNETPSEKNLDYLTNSLKYLGFGENLNEALKSAIGEGKKEFTLNLQTEMARQPFSATLHFRRSDHTDAYFFNKWEAELKNEAGKMQQTFYINKGSGITLKEGFNLLEGRAVHKELTGKEGQKYSAWLQLDKGVVDKDGNHKLRQYHQNYGYNLEETLSRYPIRELGQDDSKEKLLYSLQKGNLHAVTFEKNGFAEKLYIEAAPQFKSLNVYDPGGHKIPAPDLEKRFEATPRNEPAEVTLVGRPQINAKEVDGPGVPGPQTGVRPPNGEKEALLPKKEAAQGLVDKKRHTKGKGLHP